MNRLPFMLGAFMILTAIMLHSGKIAIAELLLQASSLVLLSILLIKRPFLHHSISIPYLLFIVVGFTLVLLYMLPIPMDDWKALSGRSFYTEVITWLQQQNVMTITRVSLIPGETMWATLSLLPPLAIFLIASTVDDKQLHKLVSLLFTIAALEAALALIQFSTNANPVFLFGMPSHGNSGQGTYLNRDHFVALMEMTLPLAIALMMYSFGRHRSDSDDTWVVAHQNLIYSLLVILLFIGAIFSRSRAGIFLSLFAILISSITFARHVGGKQAAGITATLTSVGIGLAVSIGLAPVLNRFLVHDPLEDSRWVIFENTVKGIKAFFPLGSGPGTFSDVYRAFQPIEQMKFINHAHNDYLELLFEMGAAGAFIIAFFLLLYIYGWVKLWGGKWDQMHFLQVAAGISIFLLLLHSFVDFNLHTPANMIVFAFMCGIFFRKTKAITQSSSRRKRAQLQPE